MYLYVCWFVLFVNEKQKISYEVRLSQQDKKSNENCKGLWHIGSKIDPINWKDENPSAMLIT